MTRGARTLWAVLESEPVPTTLAGTVRDTAVAAIIVAANRADDSGARELGVTPDELDLLARSVLFGEASETLEESP